jgi:nicotinamidase-related amidase
MESNPNCRIGFSFLLAATTKVSQDAWNFERFADHPFTEEVKNVCLRSFSRKWPQSVVVISGGRGGCGHVGLPLRAGEVVLHHHRMFDSFRRTDLHDQVRMHGIEKVVLAGLTSQTCIEGTGRHALEAFQAKIKSSPVSRRQLFTASVVGVR